MGDMALKKAARHSCNYDRASVPSIADKKIVADWERGTFWAGVILGISFALMGLIGGWLGW